MNYYYITVKILDNNFIFNTYNHLEEAEIIFDKLCNMMNPPQVFSLDELFLIMKGLDCQEALSSSKTIKAFINGYLDICLLYKTS